jgi:hypothetical protein
MAADRPEGAGARPTNGSPGPAAETAGRRDGAADSVDRDGGKRPARRTAPQRQTEAGRLATRVHDAYVEEVDRTHQSLLAAWVAFGVTFGFLRALTYAIREELVPWGNVELGTVHVHHYVWGVALLLVVGLVSLIVDTPKYNPWLGLVYGVAAALVIDEYALLLNLRDVYWQEEGRVSVDVALGTIAALGVYLTAASFWRRLGRELVASLRRRRSRSRSAR